MKTLEELQQFYQTDLLDDLRELESRRVQIVKKMVTAGIVIGGVMLVLEVVLLAKMGNPMALLFPVVLFFVIAGIAVRFMSKGFVSDFKERVIRQIVEFIDTRLDYSPTGCISEPEYMASRIFRQGVDRYDGEDSVGGTVGATAIKFSEVHSQYKTTSTDSKGRTTTHWHTIFRGLFFIGDFNKHFKGETFVLPDTTERLFGKFAQMMQSWNKTRGQLVRLEDAEFEKMFAVYSSDQIEARYILSMSLMQRIAEFKKKSRHQIHISFVGSQVYVAISFGKNLFEPKLFSTLLDFGPIREYFEDLQLAIGIVEDLNLNTRIWSKE